MRHELTQTRQQYRGGGYRSSPQQPRSWQPQQWGQPAIPGTYTASPSYSSKYVAPLSHPSGILQAGAAADQQMTVALSMDEHFGFELHSSANFFGVGHIYPGLQAERLGIEVGAEIKAINTWRVSNQAEYNAALAAASQMGRPGTINVTVTIPQDE